MPEIAIRKSYIATLIYTLIGAIESGGASRITVRDAIRRMDEGTVLDWLRGEFPKVGRFVNDDVQNERIAATLRRYAGAVVASKYCVEDSGLCLLLAVLVEIGLMDHDGEVKGG